MADVIGLAPGAKQFAAMNLLLLTKRMLAITDTYVNENPSAEKSPRSRAWPPTSCVASASSRASRCCRIQLRQLELGFRRARCAGPARSQARPPPTNVDGEMHGDAALSEEIREKLHPDSRLGRGQPAGDAQPDAANISFNLMKVANGDGVSVGPILLGAASR